MITLEQFLSGEPLRLNDFSGNPISATWSPPTPTRFLAGKLTIHSLDVNDKHPPQFAHACSFSRDEAINYYENRELTADVA